MQIKYIPTGDLIPYENNPRENDGEAVEYVKNSIENFGFKVPIVIDRHNTIVCGHTRHKAAELLGMKDVPCVVADDLDEEQIRAYRLADNKVAEFAQWDFDALGAELEAISGTLDMSMFGFYEADESYIDNLFDEVGEKEKPSQKETAEEKEKTEFFVTVRFDTEEALENFIEHCEQQGFDYERSAA